MFVSTTERFTLLLPLIAVLCFGVLIPHDITWLTDMVFTVYVVVLAGMFSAIGGGLMGAAFAFKRRNFCWVAVSIASVASLWAL